MFNIDYSILCHYPSYVSMDCITLALLFFNVDTKETIFLCTKNWKRVESFNDSLDIELIKLQFEGINEEIHEIAQSPNFSLDKYTKFFVNDLKFSKVISTQVDDFHEFINECKKQYLILDYKKSERPSKEDQLKFIKQYIKTNKVEQKPSVVKGYFNENVKFDFIIDDYAFKLFRLEDRNANRLIHTVKDWAYDAIKLKDKYKIIFITDIDFNEYPNYKTIRNILKEEAYKIITFNELISFIQSLNENIKSSIS